MALRDLSFHLSYNSGDNDIVNEFYIPCFSESCSYHRAVGFFTSSLLTTISKGLQMFAENEGKAKLICSPILEEADIEAILSGYKTRKEVIEGALLKQINNVSQDVINNPLNYLSWLIANNRLDIKVAIPNEIDSKSYGIYHEKIGIFRDKDGNMITFTGSNNETLSALMYNYESFDVYCSWREPDRCTKKFQYFEKIWNGESKGLAIYDFPEAIKMQILKKIPPQNYLPKEKSYEAFGSQKQILTKEFQESLWYFQKEAINAFKENQFKGILSMATGTGKTKTSIGAIIELKKENDRLFAVIACPQNTIMKQWESDISKLNIFQRSIIADGTNPKWDTNVADTIIDFNAHHIKDCVVYTTYNTLCSGRFTNLVSSLEDNTFLICDEVHWAGADTFQNGLLPNFIYRLGLSATPQRYMDEEGSDLINQYFEKVIYEFPLERALQEINPATGKTFLCPYDYYPIFVCLNDNELSEYKELSAKISQQYAKEKKSEQKSKYLQRLCEQRQEIITDAEAKYEALEALLDSIKYLHYLLIYCSPKQISIAQDVLNKKGIINHKFTGEEGTNPKDEYGFKSERDYILENFESGAYNALVAMKCLDEGVNILRAETGILMASTGNPKQYIQRRGRLLRRHKDKNKVNIYDIIVLPYLDEKKAQAADEEEIKIINKELVRYEEFANLADNKANAVNKIYKVKKAYSFFKINKE